MWRSHTASGVLTGGPARQREKDRVLSFYPTMTKIPVNPTMVYNQNKFLRVEYEQWSNNALFMEDTSLK